MTEDKNIACETPAVDISPDGKYYQYPTSAGLLRYRRSGGSIELRIDGDGALLRFEQIRHLHCYLSDFLFSSAAPDDEGETR